MKGKPILGFLVATCLHAQFVVKLSPQTIAEFDRYTQSVEAQLKARWSGEKSLVALEDDSAAKQRVLAGEVLVEPLNPQPVTIKDGLIHDWRGDVFIPRAPIARLVALLEDFDNHANVYPEVSESHTLRRSGTQVTGSWRLKQKGLVPVILDVTENVTFAQLRPGQWKGAAYARDITEVDTALFSHGRKFPLGEGHGYLWRLYGYWTLEAIDGGVLAECRTLSLSRDIPQGLGWAVGPYVRKQPRDSLTSTLANTRQAAAK